MRRHPGLRIPGHSATDSAGFRPPIPTHSDHCVRSYRIIWEREGESSLCLNKFEDYPRIDVPTNSPCKAKGWKPWKPSKRTRPLEATWAGGNSIPKDRRISGKWISCLLAVIRGILIAEPDTGQADLIEYSCCRGFSQTIEP